MNQPEFIDLNIVVASGAGQAVVNHADCWIDRVSCHAPSGTPTATMAITTGDGHAISGRQAETCDFVFLETMPLPNGSIVALSSVSADGTYAVRLWLSRVQAVIHI